MFHDIVECFDWALSGQIIHQQSEMQTRRRASAIHKVQVTVDKSSVK